MAAGKRVSGSITVYLALVFVLILSLIAVSLEAAAASLFRSRAASALASGMESALADYYRPLFDEYGIFALDLGYGDSRGNRAELEKRIARIMRANAGGGEVISCDVKKTAALNSEGGKYFIEQAVEAEKIKMAEGLLESLGERLGLIAGQSEVNTVLTRKAELEEEFAGIDMYTAELMGLIDGVGIDTELMLEGRSGYRIRNLFVKRFMVNEASAFSVGINSSKLFEKLKPRYINPAEELENLAVLAEEYARLLTEKERLEAEVAAADEEIKVLEEAIAKTEKENDASDDTEEVPEGEAEEEDDPAAEEKAALAELIEKRNMLYEKYSEARSAANHTGRQYGGAAADLRILFSETVYCLREVEDTALSAMGLAAGLRPKVDDFEELLGSMEGVIDGAMLEELGSSLTCMKDYVGAGDSAPATDFETIRATASADRRLLEGSGADAILSPPEEDPAVLLSKIPELKELAGKIKAFSYEGMYFDYVSFEAADTQDALLEGLNGFVLEPLSEIWLDFILEETESLSEAELKTFLLPGVTGKETSENEGSAEASGFEGICAVMKNGLGAVYEKALLCMYMHDHFGSFAGDARAGATVLKYEQEYLLCGNPNDRVNLAGAMARILLLRTVLAGVFVFTDSEVNAKAAAAAQSIAGFTGLPFLTAIVKYLILTIWAFEQAVVEVAAIARGKKVPIITTKGSLCIGIEDLLSFSEEFVNLKAEGFAESGVSLSYEEYILALLLSRRSETLAGRSLDLIQENIRYAYGNNFLIVNCAVGFEAEAVLASPAAYLRAFPGIYKGGDIRGYSVTVSSRKAY